MVKFKGKLGFFDTKEVINALDRASIKILNEFGRNVRKAALASIPYADKASSPGSPPHTHRSRSLKRTSKKTGKVRIRSVSLLRELLYYKYDVNTKSVVIGPERAYSTIDPDSLPALEFGGTARISDHGKLRTAKIAARPFMGPALELERPGLAPMWENSIR